MTQVDTDELKAIALRNLHKIPTGRGDTLNAFLQVMLNWLAEWVGDKEFRRDVTPGYSAFVLAPDRACSDQPSGAEETFLFKEDTTPKLGGNIYFTDYALNNVWRLRSRCQDLSDVIKLLKSRQLSHCPFVAFDVDAQLVYVFLDGSEKLSFKFALRVDIPRPFTIEVFVEMLDDIYKQVLKYPQPVPQIWHDATNRVPCKQTELKIQGYIVLILRARAQGSRKSTAELEWLTIFEHRSNAGRADIAVYRDNKCIVVSELKVLRYCHFPCPNKRKKRLASAKSSEQRKATTRPQLVAAVTNEKWALRGARQAARYGQAEGAAAALILYDMRDSDADLSAVRAKCSADNVRYARYYLHNELPDEG